MDSKKLEALVVSVEQGSFTRAAEQLGYTQSGLSHMMNALEKDLGIKLLVRSRSGVQLTAAGERVYPLIEACLRSERQLAREIEQLSTQGEETVRLAAYSSIATHWLPEVIERFRRHHPGTHVDIKMGSVEEVYRWVSEGKVDMAFASRQEAGPLHWTTLRRDPLLAILPPDYDPGADSFDIRLLEGRDFLMPSMGFDHDIMPILTANNVKPIIRKNEVSDSAIISMVAHGLGVSIMAELIMRGRQDTVRALPLQPAAARELGILSRPLREMAPIARHFLQFSREMIETL